MRVILPDGRRIVFPDNMTPEEVVRVIESDFAPDALNAAAEPSPAPPEQTEADLPWYAGAGGPDAVGYTVPPETISAIERGPGDNQPEPQFPIQQMMADLNVGSPGPESVGYKNQPATPISTPETGGIDVLGAIAKALNVGSPGPEAVGYQNHPATPINTPETSDAVRDLQLNAPGPEAVGYKNQPATKISTPEDNPTVADALRQALNSLNLVDQGPSPQGALMRFLREGPQKPENPEAYTMLDAMLTAANRFVPTINKSVTEGVQAVGDMIKDQGTRMAERSAEFDKMLPDHWRKGKKTADEYEATDPLIKVVKGVGEKISDAGRIGTDYWQKLLEDNDVPDDLRGKLWDHPEYLKDPRWLIVNVGDAAASLVPVIMAHTIFKPLELGTVAAGAVGAEMEAAPFYNELVKDGVEKPRAALAATGFGIVTGVLNAIGAEKIMGKAPAGLTKKAIKRLVAGGTEAATEYLEEPAQAAIEGITKGKPLETITGDVIQALKNIDVIPGSFILGAGIGGSKSPEDTDTTSSTDTAEGIDSEVVTTPQQEPTGEEVPSDDVAVAPEPVEKSGGGVSVAELEVTEPQGPLPIAARQGTMDQSEREEDNSNAIAAAGGAVEDKTTVPAVTSIPKPATASIPEPTTTLEDESKGPQPLPPADPATRWDAMPTRKRELVARAAGMVKKDGSLSKFGEAMVASNWDKLNNTRRGLVEKHIDAAENVAAPGATVESETPIEMRPPTEQDQFMILLGMIEEDMKEGHGREFEGYTDGNAPYEAKWSGSTYPDYFKNKGLTSKEVLNVIDKIRRGDQLTEKQATMIESLVDDAAKWYEGMVDQDTVRQQQVVKPDEQPQAKHDSPPETEEEKEFLNEFFGPVDETPAEADADNLDELLNFFESVNNESHSGLKESVAAQEPIQVQGAKLEEPRRQHNEGEITLIDYAEKTSPLIDYSEGVAREEERGISTDRGEDTRPSNVERLSRTRIVSRVKDNYDVGVSKIESPHDAAVASLPISREAQETIVALVTDTKDRPIAAIRHTIGGPSETSLHFSTLLAHVHAIPGAANVWLTHNHLSGSETLSSEDILTGNRAAEMLRDTGIKYRGIAVITPDGNGMWQKGNRNESVQVDKSRNKKGGVVTGFHTREIETFDKSTKPTNSPEKLVDAMKGRGSGVMLLSTSLRPLMFVPMAPSEMTRLRTGQKGTGASRLWRAIHESNATAIAVNVSQADSGHTEAIRNNIARFARDTDIRYLDTITPSGSLRDSKLRAPTGPFASAGRYAHPEDEQRAGEDQQLSEDEEEESQRPDEEEEEDADTYAEDVYEEENVAFDMPELVELATEIANGRVPVVKKHISRNAGVTGMFFPSGDGRIELRADVFKDLVQAAKTLAHEIGHFIDYLPDKSMSRGNILGRIASLHRYLKHTLPEKPGAPGALTKEDRARIRKEAEKLARSGAEKEIDQEITKGLKITPEQVLDVWNSVTNTLPKDVLDFIAGKSSAWKKSVIKAALKGAVHDDLQRFVESLSSGASGKVPSDAVAKIYRRLIREEIKRRRLWELEAMMEEAKAFTHKWRPFDKDHDPKYTKYRYSSEELYADLFSALVTAPSYLEREAPMFWRAFHNYLGQKPEAKAIYERIRGEISRGSLHLAQKRKQDIIRTFGEGDKKRLASMEERDREALADTFMRGLIDVNHEATQHLRKLESMGGLAREKARKVRNLLESVHYITSLGSVYFNDVMRTVVAPLERAGVSLDDLNYYLFEMRLIGNEETTDTEGKKKDRADKANPLGHTAETAKTDLPLIAEHDWGPEKTAAIKEAAARFRKLREEFVIPRAEKSGLYTDRLLEVMRDWKHYVTFAVSEYFDQTFGTGVGGRVFHQVGTFKGISSPFVETIMKDMSMVRAAVINEAKDSIARTFEEIGLITIADKKYHPGVGMVPVEPKDPEKALFTVMRDGKPETYVVPKHMADMFSYDPIRGTKLATFWRVSTQWLKELLVAKNPIWMARNVIKDFLTTVKNNPEIDISDIPKLAEYYNKAAKIVFDAEFGDGGMPPEYRRLMENMAIPADRVWAPVDETMDSALDRMAKEFHVSATSAKNADQSKNALARYIARSWRTVGKVGRMSDLVGKIAGAMYLEENTDLPEHEIYLRVRDRIGTPNSKRVGAWHLITNNLFLFSNIGKEGIRSSIESFNEDRGAYVWKTLVLNIAPKAMWHTVRAGIAMSLLQSMGGDDDDLVVKVVAKMEQCMRGASRYDRYHYNCIPLWVTEDSKSVYLRLPEDYEGQFFSAVVGSLLEGRVLGMGGAAQALMSQIPWAPNTMHPVAVVGWDILNYYLQGHNPVDTWRGIPVLSRQEYEAGGKFAAAALGKYAYNELGGPIVYRMANSYERLNDDAISRALRAAPLNVFGSFIKITDQGYREDIRDIQQQITRKKARESLVLSALAERLVREPEKEPVLTAEEREALAALGVDRLMEKTKEKASKINTTWFAQAIKSAQGPEEKAAVLLYIMNWEKRYGQ